MKAMLILFLFSLLTPTFAAEKADLSKFPLTTLSKFEATLAKSKTGFDFALSPPALAVEGSFTGKSSPLSPGHAEFVKYGLKVMSSWKDRGEFFKVYKNE